MSITHSFVSSAGAATDPDKIGGPDWNDDHTIVATSAFPGYEFDYVQSTGSVSLTANTEGAADTVLTGTSQAYAAVPMIATFFCPRAATQATSGAAIVILLYDGATVVGRMALFSTETAAVQIGPIHAAYRFTPTAATHQYIIKGYSTSGSASLIGGAGGSSTELPTFFRITKV